jgi:hypothetical protein
MGGKREHGKRTTQEDATKAIGKPQSTLQDRANKAA